MQPHFECYYPVFFSPLITFSLTPDLVSWDNRQSALEGLAWRNIGTRATHYPADAQVLINWAVPLRQWVDLHPRTLNTQLSPEKLLAIAKTLDRSLIPFLH